MPPLVGVNPVAEVHLTGAGLAAEATPVAGRGSLNGAVFGLFASNGGRQEQL